MAFAGFGRQIFAVFVCANFTLASAPVSAKSKLKSQSFDESKFVADEYAPAKKKGRRGPASAANHASAAKSGKKRGPTFSAFNVDGRKVRMVQAFNKEGRIVSQILLSEGRAEFSLDRNGDGLVDTWEMSNKDGRMELSEPYNGNFLTMKIEHRLKDTAYIMKYGYRPSTKMYKLYAVEKKPFEKLNYQQDIVIGCREKDAELQQFASELSKHLQSSDNASQLRKTLEKDLLDDNCRKPPFQEMAPSMVDGVMKVALSDPNFENKKTRDEEKAEHANKGVKEEKGTFLQCLRHYELDTHASRIMSAIGQFTSKVDKDNRYQWGGIKCEVEPGQVASYQYENPPTLYFHATKDTWKNPEVAKKVKTADPAQAYARVFFHEMLHFSLIADEGVTKMIEGCCATPEGEGTSCKELEDYKEDRKMAQRVLNTVKKNVPDFTSTLDGIRDGMGPAADIFVDRLALDTARAFRDHPNDPKKRGEAVQKIIDDFFGGDNSKCHEFATYETDGEVEAFCDSLKAVAQKLSGLEINESELAAACAKYADHRSEFRNKYAVWKRLLLPDVKAYGADKEYGIRALCETAKGAKELSYADVMRDSGQPSEQARAQWGTVPSEANDTQRETGSSTRIPGSSGTQTSYRPSTSRPIYSDDQSQVDAIRKNLDNTDGVYARSKSMVESYSNTLARIAIDPAQASEAKASGSNNSNSSAPTRSSADSKRDNGIFKTQLPDPFSPSTNMQLSSNGSNNSGRSAMAGPVSAAQAAANARLAARQVASVGESDKKKDGAAQAAAVSGGGRSSSANGVGGLANVGASNNGAIEKKQTAAEREADARALKNLLAYLQGPYDKVKPELTRPQVVDSLLRHKVQVVDDEGRVHGSAEGKHKLDYDANKNRLQLKSRAPASVRKRK